MAITVARKLNELTESTTIDSNDLLYGVIGGNSRKIRWGDIFPPTLLDDLINNYTVESFSVGSDSSQALAYTISSGGLYITDVEIDFYPTASVGAIPVKKSAGWRLIEPTTANTFPVWDGGGWGLEPIPTEVTLPDLLTGYNTGSGPTPFPEDTTLVESTGIDFTYSSGNLFIEADLTEIGAGINFNQLGDVTVNPSSPGRLVYSNNSGEWEDTTSPSANQVTRYNDSANGVEWVDLVGTGDVTITHGTGTITIDATAGATGPTNFSELGDVTVNPSSPGRMVYSNDSSEWVNTLSPTSNQVTRYNNDVSGSEKVEWVDLVGGTNVTITHGTGTITIDATSGGGGGATTLSDLTDINTTGAADGQILRYYAGDGEWKPSAPLYNRFDPDLLSTSGNAFYDDTLQSIIGVDANEENKKYVYLDFPEQGNLVGVTFNVSTSTLSSGQTVLSSANDGLFYDNIIYTDSIVGFIYDTFVEIDCKEIDLRNLRLGQSSKVIVKGHLFLSSSNSPALILQEGSELAVYGNLFVNGDISIRSNSKLTVYGVIVSARDSSNTVPFDFFDHLFSTNNTVNEVAVEPSTMEVLDGSSVYCEGIGSFTTVNIENSSEVYSKSGVRLGCNEANMSTLDDVATLRVANGSRFNTDQSSFANIFSTRVFIENASSVSCNSFVCNHDFGSVELDSLLYIEGSSTWTGNSLVFSTSQDMIATYKDTNFKRTAYVHIRDNSSMNLTGGITINRPSAAYQPNDKSMAINIDTGSYLEVDSIDLEAFEDGFQVLSGSTLQVNSSTSVVNCFKNGVGVNGYCVLLGDIHFNNSRFDVVSGRALLRTTRVVGDTGTVNFLDSHLRVLWNGVLFLRSIDEYNSGNNGFSYKQVSRDYAALVDVAHGSNLDVLLCHIEDLNAGGANEMTFIYSAEGANPINMGLGRAYVGTDKFINFAGGHTSINFFGFTINEDTTSLHYTPNVNVAGSIPALTDFSTIGTIPINVNQPVYYNYGILSISGANSGTIYTGTTGNDTITPTGTGNQIFAGSGNDTIDLSLTGGGNRVYCGSGTDTVDIGSTVNNTIYTETGSNNVVYGDRGDNLIFFSSSSSGDKLRYLAGLPTGDPSVVNLSSQAVIEFSSGGTGISGFGDLTITATNDALTLVSFGATDICYLLQPSSTVSAANFSFIA